MTSKKGVIGLDISSLGKNIFGGVHTAGGALARAFGAGAAVDALTKIETNAGLLPSWAQGSSAAKPASVASPDFIVIVHAAPQQPDVIIGPVSAIVTGGKRFDGNGYKSGQGFGSSFSFGYDGPTKIDVTAGSATTSYANPKQVLFLGGTEASPTAPATGVKGDEMSEILGIDWSQLFYNPLGLVYSPASATASHQSGKAYYGGVQYVAPVASVAAQSGLTTARQQLASTKAALTQARAQRLQASIAVAASTAASGTSVSVASPSTVSPGDLQAALAATVPASDSTTDASASTTGSSDGSTPTVVGLERSKTMEFDILGNKILGDLASAGDADATQATTPHHHHHRHPVADQVQGHQVHPAMKGTYLHGCEILGAMSPISKGVLPPVHPSLPGTLGARLAITNSTISNVKNSTVPPAGIVLQKAPATGRTFTSLKFNPMKKKDPATSVSNAKTAGARAVSVGQKLAAASAKLGATKVKGDDDWTEIVGETDAMNWTEIVGETDALNWTEILGAVATKAIGPRLTAAKLKQIADATVKIGKDTLDHGTKFDTAYKASAKKIAAGSKAVSAKIDPRGSTSIKGIEELEAQHSILGDFLDHSLNQFDVLGQYYDPLTGQYDSPYPSGTTGTTGIDPTTGLPYPTSSSGIDPMTGMSYASEGMTDPTASGSISSSMAGPPDYGLGAAPTTAPIPSAVNGDFVADPGYATDTNVYDSTGAAPNSLPVPDGAVVYVDDGTHSFTGLAKAIGSFGYFHQGVPGSKSRDGNGSGYVWRGKGWVAYIKSASVNNDQKLKSDEAQSLPIMAQNSLKNNWGPLIGNPAGGWTAGLRFDMGGNGGLGQWFWYQDTARKVAPWSVAATDAIALNQAVTDYKANLAAAAADYASAVAQDQLDAQNAATLAQQQAQEDAVAQHQQEMAQNQANSDAQNQMTALQPQQAQLQQQYMQQQMQQQQQESQYEQQMAQQQMQMQAMQMDYLKQNPSAMAQMFAPPPPDDSQYAQQQGGYGDQGGSGYSGGDSGYGDDDSVDAGIDWDDGSNNGRDSIDDME